MRCHFRSWLPQVPVRLEPLTTWHRPGDHCLIRQRLGQCCHPAQPASQRGLGRKQERGPDFALGSNELGSPLRVNSFRQSSWLRLKRSPATILDALDTLRMPCRDPTPANPQVSSAARAQSRCRGPAFSMSACCSRFMVTYAVAPPRRFHSSRHCASARRWRVK